MKLELSALLDIAGEPGNAHDPGGPITTKAIAFSSVIAAAIALRTVGLKAESLDGDSVFSVRLASLNWQNMIDRALVDIVHPPGYYALLKLALWLPLDVRALTIAASIALVACVAFVDKQSWSAALVAFSSMQIFYAQQARGYALYALVVFLVVVAIHKGWKWALLPLSALAVALHYVAALYLLCLGLTAFALWPEWRKPFIVAGAGCAAILLPWLYFTKMAQIGLERNLDWVASPSMVDLVRLFGGMGGAVRMPLGSAVSLLFFGGLALLAFKASRDRLFDAALVCAIVPPVALFGATLIPGMEHVFGERHLLPSQACWAIVAARGIGNRDALGLAAVAMAAAASVPMMWRTERIPYERIASTIHGAPAFTSEAHTLGLPVEYYSGNTVGELLPGRSGEFAVIYRGNQPEGMPDGPCSVIDFGTDSGIVTPVTLALFKHQCGD